MTWDEFLDTLDEMQMPVDQFQDMIDTDLKEGEDVPNAVAILAVLIAAGLLDDADVYHVRAAVIGPLAE